MAFSGRGRKQAKEAILEKAKVPKSVFADTEEELSESEIDDVPPLVVRSKASFFSRKSKSSEPAPSKLGTRRMSLGLPRKSRLGSVFGRRRSRDVKPESSMTSTSDDQPPTRRDLHASLAKTQQQLGQSLKQGARASSLDAFSERLAAFERGSFNLEEELATLGEKGINQLRVQLAAVDHECGEKMKKLLHQNYPELIAASKGIRAMDSEMQALRMIQNRGSSLLNALKDIAHSHGCIGDAEATAAGSIGWGRTWADSPEGLKWNAALQELDVAIGEKRPAAALPLLKKAEKALLPTQKSGMYSHSLGGGSQDLKTERQARELALRRKQLGHLVTSQMVEAALGSDQMHTATQVLASLLGRAHALKKHLEAHSAQIRREINQLLKPQNAGGDADGTEFANALGQRIFGAIDGAAEDVTIIFGKDLKELGAMFLVWALSETEKCVLLLKRHALSPFAAPAGLGPTAACCLLVQVHCAALQATHGLHLSPRLMRDLWPSVDQVLQRRVKRIIDDLRGAVASEINRLVEKGLPVPFAAGGWSDLMQIFPSADLLLDELEAVVKILTPLASPRCGEALSHAITQIFREYTNSLMLQFSRYRDDEEVLPAVLDEAIEPALEVAHSLVEQFLPELTEPLQVQCGSLCKAAALTAQLTAFQNGIMPPEEGANGAAAEPDDFGGSQGDEVANGGTQLRLSSRASSASSQEVGGWQRLRAAMSSGTSAELAGLQRERSELASKQSLHSTGSAAARGIINFPATPRGVREVESESEFDEDEWLTGNGSNVLDRMGDSFRSAAGDSNGNAWAGSRKSLLRVTSIAEEDEIEPMDEELEDILEMKAQLDEMREEREEVDEAELSAILTKKR